MSGSFVFNDLRYLFCVLIMLVELLYTNVYTLFSWQNRRHPTSWTVPTRHVFIIQRLKGQIIQVLLLLCCVCIKKLCIIRLLVSEWLLFNASSATLDCLINNVFWGFVCLLLSYSHLLLFGCFFPVYLSLCLSGYFCISRCLRRIKTF